MLKKYLIISSFIIFLILEILVLVVYCIFKNHIYYFIGTEFVLFLLSFLLVVKHALIRRNDHENHILLESNIITFLNNKLNSIGKVGYFIYDKNYNIIYQSKYIQETLEYNFINKNLFATFNIDNKKKIFFNIKFDKLTFDGFWIKEFNVFILKNISTHYFISKKYNNELLAIGLINIDNFNSSLNSLNDEETFAIHENITNYIINFFIKKDIFLKKIKDEQFLFVTNKKMIEQLAIDHTFKELLSNLLKNAKLLNLNINISIGISYGLNDFKILYKSAIDNIKIGLARGGDQIIIKNYSKIRNFAISSDSINAGNYKRSTLKIYTKKLIESVQNYNNVVIVGHKYSDYDSIASIFGLISVLKNFNSNIKMHFDYAKLNANLYNSIKKYCKNKFLDKYYIAEKDLPKYINDKTILIMCDTSNIKRIDSYGILKHVKNVYAIDHHRIENKNIDYMNNIYVDSYTSSTCEIIGEMINFYFEIYNKIEIPKYIFDFLLAGILVDTNTFKKNTSERTFYIVYLIQKLGGNIINATKMVNMSKKTWINVYYLIKVSKRIKKGVYVALASENKFFKKEELAIAAEKLINFRKRSIAIVIGRVTNSKICLSFRSNDKNFNVQKLAESFNGGGNFNSSAASVNSRTIKKIYNKLIKIINK